RDGRVHASKARGRDQPVPRRELEAARDDDRAEGLRGVRSCVPGCYRICQRLPRAEGEAVHLLEASRFAAARSRPAASWCVEEVTLRFKHAWCNFLDKRCDER